MLHLRATAPRTVLLTTVNLALTLLALISGASAKDLPKTSSASKPLSSYADSLKAAYWGQAGKDPLTGQDTINDLWYRLESFLATRSSLESTSLLLATVTFLVLLMTWSSRIGQWGGRFSPFGRPQSSDSTQVNESDYSYITNDDLRKAQAEAQHPADSGPSRDTDVLVFKSKRVSYPVHFPAYSIDKGELTIATVREQAAKKTGTSDPRRIKLLYRGKNLKDDGRTCRAEGLRAGAEIMCIITDATTESQSSSESEDEGVPLDDGAANGDTPKRRRNRNKNKKKRNKKASGTSTPADMLPIPPSNTSRAPSPVLPPTPATALDKLDAINHKLQEILPQCIQFTLSPPADTAKKEYEHKRLGETILAQVLLKLDAVETEGDVEARGRRRELVREAQKVLNGLDDAMK